MLSIIVPVYNVEPYLEKCLTSIKNQTLKDFEVIIVNDGSTDNSGEIAAKFVEADKRFNLFTKANGGLVSAWKTGLRSAVGEYVGFVDSDDWVEPEMFSTMLSAIVENNADICCCGIKNVYPDRIEEMPTYFKDGVYDKSRIQLEILPVYFNVPKGCADFNRPINPSRVNKVFKRQLVLDNMRYYDESISFGEDLMMSASNMLSTEKIVFITSKYLYNYRRCENTMSGRYMPNLEEQVNTLMDSLRQIIKDKDAGVCLDSFHRDMFSFQIKLLRNAKLSNKTKKEKLADFKRILNSKYVKESLPYAKKNFGTFKGKIKYLLIKFKMKRLLFSLLA